MAETRQLASAVLIHDGFYVAPHWTYEEVTALLPRALEGLPGIHPQEISLRVRPLGDLAQKIAARYTRAALAPGPPPQRRCSRGKETRRDHPVDARLQPRPPRGGRAVEEGTTSVPGPKRQRTALGAPAAAEGQQLMARYVARKTATGNRP